MGLRLPRWAMGRRVWGLVHLGLGLAFSIGLGWLAVRGLAWEEVSRHLQRFSPTYGFLALAIFLAGMVLRAYRWQVLFVQESVPLRHLFVVQNVGIGVNNLSPWRVFSEAIQFALLTARYRVQGGVALATLGVERVLDLVASAMLLVLGVVLVPKFQGLVAVLVLALGLALVSVVVVRLLSWASTKRWVYRIPFLGPFAAATAAVERARGRLLWALFLTFAYWGTVGVTGWVVGRGLGLEMDPWVVTVVIIATLYISTALPALPAAVGTFEFAMVSILGFFAVPQASAFSYGLLVHVILFLPPVVLAVALLPREWWTLRGAASRARQWKAPRAGDLAQGAASHDEGGTPG